MGVEDWIIVIFIAVGAIIALALYLIWRRSRNEDEAELATIADDIISKCKSVRSFKNLKGEFSEESYSYIDLFDINFDIKSVTDDTPIMVTLYFSDSVTKENLIGKLKSPFETIRIGNITLNNRGNDSENL